MVGGLITAACGGSSSGSSSTDDDVSSSATTTPSDDASSTAAATASEIDTGELVVYSGRSEDLVGPLLQRFTAETGIAVSVRYAGSTELATTLLQEGDSSDADVFFAQDPASLGAVAPLMTQLDDSILDMVDERFHDDAGRWVGTSGRARVVVYDSDTIPETDLPQNLEDLVDPVWAGKMGVAPTNGSFLAFVAAMIISEGEAYTLDWLERLAANQPVDFPGNSPIVAATDAGELELGLVNHYYLLRLQAEGAGDRAANHFLTGGDAASLVMPAGAGILAGTDQMESALSFVEFLLSEASQTYFATETFEFPLATGVEASPDLPSIDEINGPDINLSDLADQLEKATDLVTQAGLL